MNSKLEIVKLKLSCKKKGPKNAKKVIIDFCFRKKYPKVSGAGVAYELGLGDLIKLPKMSKL